MLKDKTQQGFLYDMAVASRKLRTLFDARARASGMTYPRARLLLHIVRNPALMQSELAEALEVERPTMARLIDGMEKAGLVTRESKDNDRRVRRIVLTDAAQDHARVALAVAEEVRGDALKGIDPADLAVAHRVIATIMANIARAERAADSRAQRHTPPSG